MPSPATEMLEIAQRRGMTYDEHWAPQQMARLEVAVEEPKRAGRRFECCRGHAPGHMTCGLVGLERRVITASPA